MRTEDNARNGAALATTALFRSRRLHEMDVRSRFSLETSLQCVLTCYCPESTGNLLLGTHFRADLPDTRTGRCGLLLVLITSDLRRPALFTAQHSPSGSHAVSCRSYFFSGRSTSPPEIRDKHVGSPNRSPRHDLVLRNKCLADLELKIKAPTSPAEVNSKGSPGKHRHAQCSTVLGPLSPSPLLPGKNGVRETAVLRVPARPGPRRRECSCNLQKRRTVPGIPQPEGKTQLHRPWPVMPKTSRMLQNPCPIP